MVAWIILFVLVLVLGACLQGVLPLRLVTIERRRLIGRRVRLALIAALLVVDDLGPLAASRET